jgi:hypothetical protein
VAPRVARTCPVIPGFITFYKVRCTGESPFVCGSRGPTPYKPVYASNGCDFTTNLYTSPHEHGHKLSIPPNTATRILHQSYVWFRST